MTERKEDVGAAFRVFACAWAMASLFHVTAGGRWSEAPLLVGAAVMVLLRPSSVVALAALAAAQFRDAYIISPLISNHWLFTAFFNAALIATILVLAVRERRLLGLGADVYATLAPAARWSLILLYVFAVLHKLNVDWFDSAVSCATVFYRDQAGRWPWMPRGDLPNLAAIYGTLVAEAAIPILLCFRRTRWLGIVAGVAFHFVLSFNPRAGFYNFSSMLMAMFTWFIPPAVMGEWYRRGHRWLRPASWVLVATGAAVVVLAQRGVFYRYWPELEIFILIWSAYSLGFLAFFAMTTWRKQEAWRVWTAPVFRLRSAVALLPLLVFFNGMSPYLGLKTETAWAMFSNLRTEAGYSNHLFIPSSLQPFGYQRDLVQVTASSDAYFRALARNRELIPYFELRRRPETAVTYIGRSGEWAFERMRDDPRYEEIPTVWEKFMRFRSVPQGESQPCKH